MSGGGGPTEPTSLTSTSVAAFSSSSSSAAAHHQFSPVQWFLALDCGFPVAVVGFWGFWVSPISGELHRGWVRYFFLWCFLIARCGWKNSVPEVKRGLWVNPEFCLWVYANFPVRVLHPLGSSYSKFSFFWDRNAKPRPSLVLRCTSFCWDFCACSKVEMPFKEFFHVLWRLGCFEG